MHQQKMTNMQTLKRLGFKATLFLVLIGGMIVLAGCETADDSSSSNNAPSHSGHQH